MSAWDSGIFDGDDAADWVEELSANGLGAVGAWLTACYSDRLIA